MWYACLVSRMSVSGDQGGEAWSGKDGRGMGGCAREAIDWVERAGKWKWE